MYLSDAELLHRWRTRRDADAFAEIVSRHADMVFAACHRVLRNAADAEDAAQDCFVTLMKSRPRVHTTLGPWLYTVARNRALDRARSDARRRSRETANAPDTTSAADPSRAELLEWTDEAIGALPEPLREAVVARFLAGKAHREIALTLGVSESTVRYRVNKGVEHIRRALRAKGVTLTAVGLTVLLGTDFVQVAPVGLKASIGKLAIAGPGVAGASSLAAAGGMIVMKKAMIGIGLGIAVAALLAWQLSHRSGVPEAAEVVVAAKTADVPSVVEVDESVGEAAVIAVADQKSAGQDEDESPARVLQHAEIADPACYVTVTGTVRTEGGDPVAGAEVILAAQGYEDGESFKLSPEWASRALSPDHHFRGTTGSDGHYQIAGIRFRGLGRVYAEEDGEVYGQGSARVDLREGEVAENVDITVQRAAKVLGRVVSMAGQPVRDAVIRTSGAADAGLAYTDERGHFELVCGSPGTQAAAFLVYSPTHGHATFTDVPLPPGERIELKMPGTAVLRGRVVWHSGEPATGLRVYLQGGVVLGWSESDDGSQRPATTALDMRYNAEIDSRGRYEITGLDPGQYYTKIWVENADEKQYTEDVLGFLPPQQHSTWDAALGGIGEVYGLIVSEHTGEPIMEGEQEVHALFDGRNVQSDYLPGKAEYRIQLPARPEPYLICPSFSPFTHHGFERYAREVRIMPGEAIEMDLPFMERYTLSIRALDESGEPVVGAEVFRHETSRSGRKAGETDVVGRFACRDMMPRFDTTDIHGYLSVQHADFVEARSRTYIGDSGAVYPEETIVLYHAAGLAGRVVDRDGAPLDACEITVNAFYGDDRERHITVHSSRTGEFMEERALPATRISPDVTVLSPSGERQSWTFAEAEVAAGGTLDLGILVFDPPVEEGDREAT